MACKNSGRCFCKLNSDRTEIPILAAAARLNAKKPRLASGSWVGPAVAKAHEILNFGESSSRGREERFGRRIHAAVSERVGADQAAALVYLGGVYAAAES
jgi:hypothetical protein